jgi:tRNA-Thr(GGU) m(6)t(6)A37 methyltransferase TsaA
MIARYIGDMSFVDRLRGLLPRPSPAVIPDAQIVYQPIGVVRNRVLESMAQGWEEVVSEIALRDDLLPAVEALEGFSHVIVVFDLDRIPEDARRLRVKAGTDAAERGVLATRSQLRPNSIGVAVVRLLSRQETVLRVRGLDALNGSPVLDVKPYLPAFDAVPQASLPDWARRE